MHERLIILIKRDLISFKEVIELIDKNYDKAGVKIFGGLNPGWPYTKKYQVMFLIRYLEKNGVDVSEFKKEYDEIHGKLTYLEQKRCSDYRDKVYDKLKFYVDTYPKIIDCTFDSDPVCTETENALDSRDSLEILLMELKKDHDLQPLEEKTSVLDEVFKSKYMRNIRAYLKECPSIEKPYYPERFWWRHPSKFIS